MLSPSWGWISGGEPIPVHTLHVATHNLQVYTGVRRQPASSHNANTCSLDSRLCSFSPAWVGPISPSNQLLPSHTPRPAHSIFVFMFMFCSPVGPASRVVRSLGRAEWHWDRS
jgi:hypothetical protein